MLAEFTHATFAGLVGQRFRVHPSSATTSGTTGELELVQAAKLPVHPGRDGERIRREPFSLVFRGPQQPILPQRIYALEQETLGRIEIFLVPIGPDEVGQRYEAVFN
jgi:hypothetical protein